MVIFKTYCPIIQWHTREKFRMVKIMVDLVGFQGQKPANASFAIWPIQKHYEIFHFPPVLKSISLQVLGSQ